MEILNADDMKSTKSTVCPRCSGLFTGYPALSRRDNKTKICSVCGSEEAMFDFRMYQFEDSKEKQKVIEKEKNWLKI